MQNFKTRKKDVSTINATTFRLAQLCLLLLCMHVTRVYGMLSLKTERNKLLGSPRHIWQENIKMDIIKERGFGLWMGFIWLWTGTNYRLLSHANDMLGKY